MEYDNCTWAQDVFHDGWHSESAQETIKVISLIFRNKRHVFDFNLLNQGYFFDLTK